MQFAFSRGVGRFLGAGCLVLVLCTAPAFAQNSIITYQGRLTEGGVPPANATYDMEFKLFTDSGGVTQIGSTITNPMIAVTNGVFTVQLDFGASSFPGADRWLQIGVRHQGDPTYTTLSPREQLTASPYAIRASAVSFNGIGTGTNTTSAMTVGTGASLNTSGSGTIAATSAPAAGLTGAALPAGVTGSSLTSVGTLAGLTVSGPMTLNGTANVNTTGTSPTTIGNATGALSLTGSSVNVTATLNMGTHAITGVTSPSAGTDAANKTYVDTAVATGGGSAIGTIISAEHPSNSNATAPFYLPLTGGNVLNTSTPLPGLAQIVMPVAGTAVAMYIQTGGAAPPAFAVTYTLYKATGAGAASATALTCVSASGGVGCNSTGSVAFAAGDRFHIQAEGFAGMLPSSSNFIIFTAVHVK